MMVYQQLTRKDFVNNIQKQTMFFKNPRWLPEYVPETQYNHMPRCFLCSPLRKLTSTYVNVW